MFIEYQSHSAIVVAKNKSLCFYATFSHTPQPGLSTFHYLRSLASSEIDVVFVSASPLSSEAESELLGICTDVIVRKNEGYDFGSWKDAIMTFRGRLEKYERLILCNDSVIGPFYPLDKVINEMKDKYSFWGITDSLEKKYHIMSYFLVFEKKLLTSNLFTEIWDNVQYYGVKEKQKIINDYEIGFTGKIMNEGFQSGAFCSIFDSIKILENPEAFTTTIRYQNEVKRGRFNPTHSIVPIQLKSQNCPFIKKELIIKNPRKEYIAEVIRYILDYGYDVNILKELYLGDGIE